MRKYFIVGFIQNDTKWFLSGNATNRNSSYSATINEKLAIQFQDKSSALSRLRDFVLDKKVEKVIVHQVEETNFA